MSDTYDLFREGKERLSKGMPAQATVPLEKAKLREPDKASIREALGIAYFRISNYDAAESEFRAVLELSGDATRRPDGRVAQRGRHHSSRRVE